MIQFQSIQYQTAEILQYDFMSLFCLGKYLDILIPVQTSSFV